METTEWKAGDFAYLRGSMVRLSDGHPNPDMFNVEFVCNYKSGAGITCGGYTSAYPKELRPVTDAADILVCRAYAAKQAARLARNEIIKQERIAEINEAALAALEDARASAVAPPQGDGA